MPMNRYRGNVEAVRNLIRETEVHRDVYIDEEVFQLEMEHLFANTWVYVGHDSQVPNPGDYYGTTVGTQPILMVRHTDNTVRVLHNRCPHKGTRITTETCGNTGKFFRCPYHAWTFRTDGTLRQIPLSKGYDNAGLNDSHAAKGMNPVRHVHNYRGFVFAKLSDTGLGFEEFFGEKRHSAILSPNLMSKGPIQLIRLFKPIAANKTLVESWTFRLVDAPDMLLERTLVYNRLINAPTSVVGHDDVEVYERAQEGLKVDANQWINVQRPYDPSERHDATAVANGTTEWQMRNQFRAWSKFMTLSM